MSSNFFMGQSNKTCQNSEKDVSQGLSKPKIAILTIRNEYGYGGVLTCVKELYKFCEKYFDPTVFFLNFDPKISANLKSLKFGSQIKSEKYFGMNAIHIGTRWAFWEPGHYVYTLPMWKELLKNYDYFLMKSGSCIAAYPLVQLDKKFAMWVGTSYEDDKADRVKNLPWFRFLIDRLANIKMKKIEKDIIDRASFIWSISKNTKNRLEQILGRKRDNLIVCNFPMQVKKTEKNIENKKEKNIIAVGRFSDPRKNIEMLIKSFERINDKIPNSKLYVVGKKPNLEKLKKFEKFQSFKNIIFTGQLEQEDLDNVYKIADLMLITSHQEGLGIIGLEALSYGVPVIATDCGGTKDYIINDENGYLVKINDDKDMANKAINILQDDDLYNKMNKFSLKFIEDSFSKEKIYSIFKVGLIRVYPELQLLFNNVDEKINLDLDPLNEKELNL